MVWEELTPVGGGERGSGVQKSKEGKRREKSVKGDLAKSLGMDLGRHFL